MKLAALVKAIRRKMDPNSLNRTELRIFIREYRSLPHRWYDGSLCFRRGKLHWLILKRHGITFRFLLKQPSPGA